MVFKGWLRPWGAIMLMLACSAAQAQTWQSTLQMRDANNDGIVDSYYDAVLDITWLRNWNVRPWWSWPEAAGLPREEINYFQIANTWANNFQHLGLGGWRLPAAHNFELAAFPMEAVQGTELSHLYYVTLGLRQGACVTQGSAGCRLINGEGGLFTVGMWDNYMTSAIAPSGDYSYGFDFGPGMPGGTGHSGWSAGHVSLVTVVRDGDIALAVPEPGTYALMAAGLLAVVTAARRRRKPHRGARLVGSTDGRCLDAKNSGDAGG